MVERGESRAVRSRAQVRSGGFHATNSTMQMHANPMGTIASKRLDLIVVVEPFAASLMAP